MAVVSRKLISRRFHYSPGDTGLRSEVQQRAMQQFVDRVRDGSYEFTSTPCPCGQKASDVVIAEVDRYRLPLTSVLCMGCATVRMDPYLDPPSLDHFYRFVYQDLYARSPDPDEYFERQKVYGRKLGALLAMTAPQSVLEVGCGAGGALSVFHEAGAFVAGCDYSERLIEYGTRNGVPNLFVGSISDASGTLVDRTFDLIFLHHVFEHVDRPADTLRDLKRFLRPNGRLIIIVPDLRGIHNHDYPAGDAIGYLHVAHKYNYSPLGLQMVAEATGLAATRIQPPANQVTAWSHAPELWMELTVPSQTLERPLPNRGAGQSMLRYLRRTERLYQWGLCPPQLAARLKRLSPRRFAARAARRLGLLRRN
jgi:SAM-dependent methyltransferase